MTAPIHAATVRARIGEALQLMRTRVTKAAQARLLKFNPSTASRRSDDLEAWTIAEMADLAAYDGEFRAGLISALSGEDEGQTLDVAYDMRCVVRMSGRTIEHLMDRLGDGRISPAEARKSIPELLALREAIDQAVRDCKALVKAAR